MGRLCALVALLAGCGAARLPEGLPPPEYERPAPSPAPGGSGGAPGAPAEPAAAELSAPAGGGAGATSGTPGVSAAGSGAYAGTGSAP
jgi:hypothetical protein